MTQLFSILRTLRSVWKLWTFLPLLAAVTVFMLTRNQPRRWVSTGLVSLNTNQSKQLSLTNDVLQQYELNQRFENLLELFRSKRNAKLAMESAAVAFLRGEAPFFDAPEILPPDTTGWQMLLARETEVEHPDTLRTWLHTFAEMNEITPEHISANLSVSRVRSSNFIRVSYSASQPNRAAFMASVLSETLAREQLRLSRNRTVYDREMYERLVSQARLQLDERIRALETYKMSNSVINLGEHTKAIVNQIVQLEMELAHIKEERAAGKRALDRLQSQYKQQDLLPVDLSGNQELIKLKQELADLNRSRFSGNLGAAPSDTAAVALKIAVKKRAIDETVARVIRQQPYDLANTRQDLVNRFVALTLEVEMADERIPALENEIKRVTAYAGKFASLESNIGTLTSEIHVAQESYLILLNKLNLVKTVELGQSDQELQLIDRPAVPLLPEPSKRLLLVIMAGMGAFIIIVVLVVLAELLDRSILRPEQFETEAPFPVLAALPGEASAASGITTESVSDIRTHQLRLLRKHLTALSHDEPVVLWLSTLRGENTAAAALEAARTLVKTGETVLIINDQTGTEQSPSEPTEMEQGIHTLELFSNGQTPFEMMPLARWQREISRWKQDFRWIFVVTAPATVSASWTEWLDLATHTIHLFEANRVLQEADRRFFAQLSKAGVPVIGTVINNAAPEKMEALVGELPRKRSTIRKFSKKLLQREFRKTA
jgi:uncharacterized protein involved in exopolysaccharide biosynthesis